MLNHVLVPLDESHLAEKAIRYAESVINPSGGKITFLTVIDVPATPYMFSPGPYSAPIIEGGMDDYENLIRNLTDHAKEYLQKAAQMVQNPDIKTAVRVQSGTPAEAILEVATELDVDIVVMSTHGRSGLSRWVFGSVTQKVLNAGLVPVLVIPNIPDIGKKKKK